MLLRTDGYYLDMHDPLIGQMGMDQDQAPQHHANEAYGNESWADISSYSSSSQHQSPIHEYGSYSYLHPHLSHSSLPSESSFARMAPPPPHPHPHPHPHTATTTHQQLLPLIMPSHPTWPSMLTNPGYQAPATAPPISTAPMKPTKLPSIHAPSPRKTLTDDDRRRMCRYHEENPAVKQTEIGAMFGVERSTVSKVLRQKEKYLFPEDRSQSPVKRAKGKFPDIDRALSNWVRNSQKQGIPLTDAAIKEKARFFAATVGNSDSHVKANSTSWLEKFKQKNGIGGGKLLRRASETNIAAASSLHPSGPVSAAVQTPNGVSPTSPDEMLSPLSGSRSEEHIKSEMDGYLDFGHGYRHSNSQSTTSLSSGFTDTAPSSFSGGPTSPTTPFAFSPDTTCAPFMPSQRSRLPPPATIFQRPRSQTFPMLGIDPAYIAPATTEPLTSQYNQPVTAPASALDPAGHAEPPFGGEGGVSSPQLRHRGSNGSMVPPLSSSTPNHPSSALSSPPPGSTPSSPTQDDARRALDTLISFFNTAPQGLVEHSEYVAVLKLTEKLRLQGNQPVERLPGGLHRIPEQDSDMSVIKMEHSMSAGV